MINFENKFLNKNEIIKHIYNNNVVILRVLQIKKKHIILDGNLKSECFLKTSEFLYNNIKKKDFVEIFLKNFENNLGKIIISRLELLNYIFWKNVFLFWNNKRFIKGSIINKIKGGYSVNLNDFKCFLPFSCSDKKLSNTQYYLNKKLYFLILNFDYSKKNIVLSRKIVISKIVNIKRKVFFKNISVGHILKGIIKNITNYCIFIDTGYLECVCFFRNLTWGNYRYFIELFKIGQSITGIVLKIDKKKCRVFLGVKQLFNFWKKIESLKGFVKYARIIRINNNKTYFALAKNVITSINNLSNRKRLKYLKINNFFKITISNLNFKRKRFDIELKAFKNF